MRSSKISRKTSETDIELELNLDDSTPGKINSGSGFLDHMLNLFQIHGGIHLDLTCKGDVEVDMHHSMEDIAIVLGQALVECLGDKKGIKRYGNFILPMDETLMLCALDLSGRPYFCYDVKTTVDRLGEMDVELAKEFFYAVSYSAGMNLHIRMLSGDNNHHILEAMFKAFAKSLDMATLYDERIQGVLSTKGTI